MAYSIFVVLLPLSLRATLPIFYMAKRRGRRAGFSLYGLAFFFVQKGNSLRFPTEPIFSLIIDLACNSKNRKVKLRGSMKILSFRVVSEK